MKAKEQYRFHILSSKKYMYLWPASWIRLLPHFYHHNRVWKKHTNISVRVSTVQAVFVVQINRNFQSLLWRFGPFQNFFGPIHTKKTVHFAIFTKLLLRRIPQLIVRFRIFEFVFGINLFSFILSEDKNWTLTIYKNGWASFKIGFLQFSRKILLFRKNSLM